MSNRRTCVRCGEWIEQCHCTKDEIEAVQKRIDSKTNTKKAVSNFSKKYAAFNFGKRGIAKGQRR